MVLSKVFPKGDTQTRGEYTKAEENLLLCLNRAPTPDGCYAYASLYMCVTYCWCNPCWTALKPVELHGHTLNNNRIKLSWQCGCCLINFPVVLVNDSVLANMALNHPNWWPLMPCPPLAAPTKASFSPWNSVNPLWSVD